MNRYSYAFRISFLEEDVFFCFPKFPDLISSVRKDIFRTMGAKDIEHHASDAVVTALQARISCRGEIPLGENQNLFKADGFIVLSVQQAMKLELYLLFRENGHSFSDFAKQIGKKETVVRRMLNLRHPSLATEIELAVESFGKRLVHSWDIEVASSSGYSARSVLTSRNLSHSSLDHT